jgi:hypothetical protein
MKEVYRLGKPFFPLASSFKNLPLEVHREE